MPVSSERPRARPRKPKAPAVACLVCGKPVGRSGATLCLDCLHKSERQRRPRFAGGARTEFGTRVARAVTCVRCGKEDHVAFKPRDPARVMCRACTEEVVGLDEHGDPRKARHEDITCQQCGKTDRIPLRHKSALPDEDVEPTLCRDCFFGIETRQQDRTRTGERRKSGVILKRKASPA